VPLDDAQLAAVSEAVTAVISRDSKALRLLLDERDQDIYRWTRDYGAHGPVELVMPPGPPSGWAIDSSEVSREGGGGIWVVVEMWTREEGRSDLSLELKLQQDQGGWTARIHDLHVL
jgi:hypothetical protein